jgi:hypothetical protein
VRFREVLRAVVRDVFRDGTFPPFSRASLNPIAIACLRLVTFRPEPLLSVPFFVRLIADSTRFEADRPYFFAICILLECPTAITTELPDAPVANRVLRDDSPQALQWTGKSIPAI